MKEPSTNEALLARIEELKKNPRVYLIAMDTYSDDKESAFCLGYMEGDKFVTLLAKTETNKESFIEEVNNLMKYFNAVKIEKRGKGKERTNRIKG